MSQHDSVEDGTDDDVLIAEFGMSRPLVLQWTVVSTVGFLVSLFGFLLLYYAVTGDAAVTEFALTPETGWWNLGLTLLVVAGLTLLVIFPHELCHGLAIRAFGGQSRYGLGVVYFVFPYAFATTDTRFTRNQFIVIALTPLVVLSVIGVPIMVVFEWTWLAIPLAMNAGGAVGDIWMVLTLLSYPSGVSVIDTTTGLEVYGPPGFERSEAVPATVVWDLFVGIAGGVLVLAVIGGMLVPLILSTIGIDSLTLGVPDSPLLIVEFIRTNGGIEFTMGAGVIAIGALIGICYAYVRARRRG